MDNLNIDKVTDVAQQAGNGFDFSGLIYLIIGIILLFSILYTMWVIYQNALVKQLTQTGVLMEVVLEKDTETIHLSVDQMWSSFYSGLYIPWYKRPFKPQPYITFEIKSENTVSRSKKEITFNFWVPEDYKTMIKQRILGLYPKAQINEIEDYIPEENDRMRVIETAQLGLKEDSAFSIKLFDDFNADPLSSITSAMTELENREIAIVQLFTRPTSPSWRKKAEKTLLRYEKTGKKPTRIPEWLIKSAGFLLAIFKILDVIISTFLQSNVPEAKIDIGTGSADSQRQKDMLKKVMRNPFSFQVRILVGSPFGSNAAKEKIRNISASFKELDGTTNSFERELVFNKKSTYYKMKNRYFSVINTDDVLTTVELAGFAHLPNKTNYTPGLKKIQSKRTEFPADIATDEPFAIAIDSHGNERPVGLDLDGRMRHVYVSGMTGVGKSTLLENMIIRDIETGKGAVVVDPHGKNACRPIKKFVG